MTKDEAIKEIVNPILDESMCDTVTCMADVLLAAQRGYDAGRASVQAERCNLCGKDLNGEVGNHRECEWQEAALADLIDALEPPNKNALP